MAAIVTTTEVDRSADDVFAYATDPTRFHEWQQGVVDGHLDQPGNPAVGTRCFTTRRIGGANRPSTSEITHINPPKTWGVRGVDGPIRATVDLTVEPVTAQQVSSDHRGRLHRPRHRQAARSARRAARGSQRDADEPGNAQAASRTRLIGPEHILRQERPTPR